MTELLGQVNRTPLYVNHFSVHPGMDPALHGVITGDADDLAWQQQNLNLRLDPGVGWRSPAFSVNALGYVRLSFRARRAESGAGFSGGVGVFNRANIAFKSINAAARWNLDPLYSGVSGGDLLGNDRTSFIDLTDQWSDHVFYSRAQVNAEQMAIEIISTDFPFLIDDVKVELVRDRSEVSDWLDQVWSKRWVASGAPSVPELPMFSSSEQRARMARTLKKLREGEEVRIVLVGDSIVGDLSHSGLDLLIEQHFPGAQVSVITAVGNGTGIQAWNPVNDAYPFISSSSNRGALRFNEAIVEQQPDLVLLGGISTPANAQGYAAIDDVVGKLRSQSVAQYLGYQPDIMLATGAFGPTGRNWYPSDELNALADGYRNQLLRIANKYDVGFLDFAGIWGSYLIDAFGGAGFSAAQSLEATPYYWRDAVHANAFGKQILGRALAGFLAGAGADPAELPRISLMLSSGDVDEDSGKPLIFTLSRTGPTTEALTVFFTVGGTAVSGGDYAGLTPFHGLNSVVFAPGSDTAEIRLVPVIDAFVEQHESVSFALDSTMGLGYLIETDTPVTALIRNDDISQVTISDVIDNVGVVQGSVPDNGVTNDTTPTLMGTLSSAQGGGEVVTVSRDGVVMGVAKVNPTTRTWTFTPTLKANGLHTFTAALLDGEGTQSAQSEPRRLLLDSTAPSQAVGITVVRSDTTPFTGNVAAGGATNDKSPTLSGTLSAALGAGETLRLYNGKVVLAEAAVDSGTLSWQATPQLLNDGTYTITARVEDAAGNQGPVSATRIFRLDTVAPLQTVRITSVLDNTGTEQGMVADGAVSNDTTPTLSGTVSAALGAGEVVAVYRDGVQMGTAKVNTKTRRWAFTPTLTANGLFTFTAAVVDAAGNRGELSEPRTFNLDSTVPTQTVKIHDVYDNTAPQSGSVIAGGQSNDASPFVSGTLSAALGAGETLRLYNGKVMLAEATVDPGTLTWQATPQLQNDGPYTFTARVEDRKGHQGLASASRRFILDTKAPAQSVTITAVTDNTGSLQGLVERGAITNDTTPMLTGTVSAPLETGEVLMVFCNGEAVGKATVNPTTGTWSLAPTLKANGAYTFTAAVVDRAGNRSPLAPPYAFTLDASTFDGKPWRYSWANASPLAGTSGLLKASVLVDSPRSGEPPLQVTALRVDLDTPGISLSSTAPINNWQANVRETSTQSTREFITGSRLSGTPVVAAINTSFFSLQGTGQPTPTDLLGLAVSNNTLVSPMHAAYPYFAYDSITGARIERDGSLTPDLSSTALAFAGMANGVVLWNDIVTYSAEQSSDLNARAAVGLSSDQRYLVLMTVDRSLRSSAPSYWGASFHDVGALLSGFGASSGLNLDGGTSTQLAWWDPGRGSAQLLNTPLFGLERHVGNNFGILYQPLN